MTHKPSPKSVRQAVGWAVSGAVDRAVVWAVDGSVRLAVSRAVSRAVHEAVDGAVYDVFFGAVRYAPDQPHPNLQRFIGEVRQTRVRWGAA